jgi:hypothetical protein
LRQREKAMSIDHTPKNCPSLPALCDDCQHNEWLAFTETVAQDITLPQIKAPTDKEWFEKYDAHVAAEAARMLAELPSRGDGWEGMGDDGYPI